MIGAFPRLQGLDALESALALVGRGAFVLRLNGKKPIDRWSQTSTSDSAIIEGWFAGRGARYNVGLDLGKSGLIAFDVDQPDLLPRDLKVALRLHPTAFHSTRRNQPGRGHHIFSTDVDYSGAYPKGWRTGWGEIKAAGHQINLGPSHPKAHEGGRHLWLRRTITPLPEELARVLTPRRSDPIPTPPAYGKNLEPCEEMECELLLIPRKPTRSDLMRTQQRAAGLHVAGHPGVEVVLAEVRRRWAGTRTDPFDTDVRRDCRNAEQGAMRRAMARLDENREKFPLCEGDAGHVETK